TVGKAGDAAVKGTDYTAPASFEITIPAGSSSAHADFTLTPTDDALDEDDKTLTLSGSAGAFTIADITITIEDDDALPVLSIADASAVTEGGQASFDITLTPVSGRDVTVAWATADDSGTNAATAGEDYTAANGTATIAAGDAKATVTVNTTDDVRDEPAETFLVKLSSPTNANLSSTASDATGTINDNDRAPTGVTLTASPDSVGEGDDPATVTVTAAVTGATTYSAATEVTVSVGASDDTATEGTDYNTQDDFTITIGAGNASASKAFTLTPKQDDLREGSEAISVDGNAGQTIAVTGDTITLTDDDGQPSFSVANASATEGSAVTFTVTRSGASGNAVSVHWNTKADVDGTNPASASDYTAATTPTKLDFGAGVKTQTFTVATAADSADEPNETFRVVLSSPGGGAAIGTAEAVGTINDDDDPPVLSISAAPVDEGADGETATMTFTVALAPASGKQVKVNYADSGTGSATSGEDYDALTSGTLTFNAGQTSKTFTVTVNGDAVDEGDETVIAHLSSPVNATLKGGGQTLDGEGVIRDDEGPLTATLALSRTSIKESGDGNSATVTASINGVSNEAIKLTVASSPVSPATAADFSLSANKVLTIAAGQRQSTGTVSITAVDNDIDAADKSLTVSATIMGGHMAQAPANVTLAIEDNDERGVTISESALTLAEASGSDTYDVVLTSEPTANVVINVASSDTGAAKVSPNKLTFAPADWDDPQTVTVTAVNDTVDNPNDQRAATISHSVAAGTSDYAGVSADSVAVTVTDDDLAPGGIALSVSPASVSESAGATTVTVTATVAGETAYAEDKTVSVTVGETDDSAVSGEDYVAVTGFSITIAKGAMSASEDFSLNPTQDSLDEINETLTVAGTESGGAVVDSATVTIEDKNDPPTLSIDAPAADEGGDRDRNPLRFTVSLSAASGKQVTVA
ncbi:MAG: hypothetical protein F4Z45_06410, partial [Gammaproteobacteria bacterium]|nr:hypothetical protein [Gammaproteobacteria bacterium]